MDFEKSLVLLKNSEMFVLINGLQKVSRRFFAYYSFLRDKAGLNTYSILWIIMMEAAMHSEPF